MREIKFREWIKDEKYTNYDFNIMSNKEISENESRVLMQFTGLKDKKGIEIYEGDIVKIIGEEELSYGYSFEWNENAIVKWSNTECCFYLDVIKKREVNICGDGFKTIDTFPLRKWEEEEWGIEYKVIGITYYKNEFIFE